METVMICNECGEKLEVTSRKAIANNIGDLQEVEIYVKPCECQKEKDNG